MQSPLKIEIGHHPFTEKEVSNDRIEKIISNMLTTLGIEIGLDITQTNKPDFITINENICRFPASLINEVDTYTGFLAKSKETDAVEDIYWELLVSNILWMQPHVLFPDEYLPAYMPALNTLPPDNCDQIKKQCKEIIDELLNLRISLVDQSLITVISNRYLNDPTIDWNDFREELIQSLASPVIILYFNQDYFDQIITIKRKENLFKLMRDGLYYESGIKYPPFKILFDNNLIYNSYCLKINSFTSIPVIGLSALNEMLVNDAPDRLSLLGIGGREAVNPANGNKVAIINITDKEQVENAGLTTWDGLGYFILGLSALLRKYGYLCIDKKFTLQYLQTLKLIFPKITELIEKEDLLSVSAKTLRLLAKEEISIRNLRVILEAILESDYIIADSHKYIIFDERIPVRSAVTINWKNRAENIVEFVRTRLKRYISHKYTKGHSSLIVYLLDPEIEKLVDPAINTEKNLPDETYKRINDAVNNEISKLPPSSQVPVILTTVTVRPYLKKIIELVYPQVAVLSYQELSPEMNIQPIARISF